MIGGFKQKIPVSAIDWQHGICVTSLYMKLWKLHVCKKIGGINSRRKAEIVLDSVSVFPV